VTYRGDVDAYGPADFRRLPDLLLAKMGLGPAGVNGYVLRCLRTEAQLLFVGAITSSRSLETIVTTHGHAPHTRALAELAETTHAVTVAHADDADALPVPPTRVVGDDDVLHVGEVALTVVHLPGHSPGSIGLLYSPSDGSAPHLFSGDALLASGCGSTATPADAERLRDSLRHRVFDVLPDGTGLPRPRARHDGGRAARPGAGAGPQLAEVISVRRPPAVRGAREAPPTAGVSRWWRRSWRQR
jgi:glyoxylase-like metal-dependent hydrolase (beta-lactamase superfamily II)